MAMRWTKQDGQVAHLAIVPISTSVTRLGTRWDLCDKSGIRHRQVIFKVEFDQGHGVGSSTAQLDIDAADVAAFTLWAAARAPKSTEVPAR